MRGRDDFIIFRRILVVELKIGLQHEVCRSKDPIKYNERSIAHAQSVKKTTKLYKLGTKIFSFKVLGINSSIQY